MRKFAYFLLYIATRSDLLAEARIPCNNNKLNVFSNDEKRIAFPNTKVQPHQARFAMMYEEEMEALGWAQNAHLLHENGSSGTPTIVPAAKFGVRKQGTWGIDVIYV